jgi:hypothetical protein
MNYYGFAHFVGQSGLSGKSGKLDIRGRAAQSV